MARTTDDGRDRRPGVLGTVAGEILSDHVQMAAAGIAFYGLFGLVPVVAAIAAVWNLWIDPGTMEDLARQLRDLLPGELGGALSEMLVSIPRGLGLGLGLAVNLAIVVWTAQRTASGLISALNVAYDEKERRGFVRRSLVGLAVAMTGMAFLFGALAVLVGGTLAADHLDQPLAGLLRWGRWPVLAVAFAGGLALLYAYAPCRTGPRWRWVAWGALAGTALWLAGSTGLVLYLLNIGSFGQYYGSLGVAVVLLMWFYIGGLAVLAGAELNAALAERREGPHPHSLKRSLRSHEKAAT